MMNSLDVTGSTRTFEVVRTSSVELLARSKTKEVSMSREPVTRLRAIVSLEQVHCETPSFCSVPTINKGRPIRVYDKYCDATCQQLQLIWN